MTPHRPLFVSIASLALAVGLGACGSSGSSSGYARGAGSAEPVVTRSADGLRINHDDWADLGYRWDWTARPFLSKRGEISIVRTDTDAIVVHETGNNTSVLEPDTGEIRWSKALTSTITRFVGVSRPDDTTLWACAGDKMYIVEMKTGNLIARQQLETMVNTTATTVGSLAIFGTPSGELIAHDTASGFKMWGYNMAGPITADPIMITDSIVGTVSQGGEVLFNYTPSGESVGRNKISGGVTAIPVTDGELMFVASTDQSVYAFEAFGGAQIWRHRTAAPITVQPVLIEGVLYCSLDEGLTALDADTGDVLWQNPKLQGWVVTTNGPELVVWNGKDLFSVDASRGDMIASTQLTGALGLRTDSQVDGNIYVITRHSIARFRAR